MENKFTNIKDRIIYFVERKGLNKEKFFSEAGTTSANFRGKAKDTPLNSNTITNIIAAYPEINLRWLLTGEGEPWKDNQEPTDGLLLQQIEKLKERIRDIEIENAQLVGRNEANEKTIQILMNNLGLINKQPGESLKAKTGTDR